jgi:hypothetical protein
VVSEQHNHKHWLELAYPPKIKIATVGFFGYLEASTLQGKSVCNEGNCSRWGQWNPSLSQHDGSFKTTAADF